MTRGGAGPDGCFAEAATVLRIERWFPVDVRIAKQRIGGGSRSVEEAE